MRTNEDATVLEPIKNTRDREPYDYYDRLRQVGGATWDEEMDAVLVGSYDLVRAVFRQDERGFRKSRREEVENDPVMRAMCASPRPLAATVGDDHARFHFWWLQAFSRSNVAAWRATKIRPVVNRIIDRFADQDRAELVEEFAYAVPARAVASVLGLPWEDDDWIGLCRSFVETRGEYIEAIKAQDDLAEIGRRATAVANEFVESVRPFAERRRSANGDDMISVFWKDGPSIFPDWNVDDVIAGIVTCFVAGSHTTAAAASNGLYLLLTEPRLQEELLAGGEEVLERFVEEGLRLYGVTHATYRYATEDIDIGGFTVATGKAVMALINSANRDPRHYECPTHVDLERANPRNHLAFAMGPRTCAGMSLARGQLSEMYQGIVERLRPMRLDPEAEAPSMQGFGGRSFKPLNAIIAERPSAE